MFIKESFEHGQYYYTINDDAPAPGTVPKIPRKSKRDDATKDYSEYVKNHLPKDYEPYSKMRMSREAMEDFGIEKYNHTYPKAVARRYVGPAMEEYGEHTEDRIWVFCDTYEPLTEKEKETLFDYFSKYRIDEKVQAGAFRDYSEGKDITPEVNRYKQAMDAFAEECGSAAVSVPKWRIKNGKRYG